MEFVVKGIKWIWEEWQRKGKAEVFGEQQSLALGCIHITVLFTLAPMQHPLSEAKYT